MAWVRQPIQSLCDVFADGDWIETKDQSEGGIRLIQTGNIGEGQFKNRLDKARYISERTFERLNCFEVLPGDCLVSRLPDPVGRACVIPDMESRAITSVDCTIIRFKPDTIYPHFFKYYSMSSHYLNDVDQQTSGATRKRISRKNLGKVKVPVPSMPEQKQIVAMLDEAFADIDKARELTGRNLKNARELFESYLSQLFVEGRSDWVEANLSKHVNFIDYRGKTPLKTESGLRLITAKNVRMGYIKRQPEEYVSADSYDTWMTRGIPKKGDVLFTTEAPLANVAQLDTDEKVVFAQRVITMQPDRSVLNDSFLKYLLMSKPIQTRIHERGTGATATGIKASLLKKILIRFPSSLAKQVELAAQLDKLSEYTNSLTEIYALKLTELENLKRSALKKAFGR